MRKYIVIVSLCLSVFLMSCDNYLDLVPKGESVLNTTDDYLGLVESMTSEFPTDDFWYFSGDATWPYKNEIENYNQYLWKKFQIIPRIIVGEQREHIVNAFARQFQELKENLGLNEKELVETILQNPEKYRNMYMERLPDYIKKWCETN